MLWRKLLGYTFVDTIDKKGEFFPTVSIAARQHFLLHACTQIRLLLKLSVSEFLALVYMDLAIVFEL